MPVTIPRRNPWVTQFLVIGALIQRDVQTRFGKYQLGFFWFFIEPLISVLVIGLLLGSLIGRTAPAMPYPFFLLNGYMLLKLFTGPMNAGVGGMKSGVGLLVFPNVRPIDTYIAKFLFELVTTMVVYTTFCCVAMWIGIELSLDRLDIVLASFFLTWLSGCGMGLILGIAAARFNELEKVLPVIQRPLIFISCVLHPAYTLPHSAKDYLMWNPLVHGIELCRNALFPLYHIEGIRLGYLCTFAIVSMGIGIVLFRSHSHLVTKR